jgi:hypothetical protein
MDMLLTITPRVEHERTLQPDQIIRTPGTLLFHMEKLRMTERLSAII